MMKKLIFLFLLLIYFSVYAQDLSSEYYQFEQKLVACMNNANSTQDDFDQLMAIRDQLAINHSNENARGYLVMGELYKEASNPALRNSIKAQSFYRKAFDVAAPDDDFVRSKALYNQGLLYYKSTLDFTQNFDSAYYYFSEATHYDDLYLVGVATLLQYGFGVEMNEADALAHYAMAIAKGSDCFADFYAVDYNLQARVNGSLNDEAFDNFRIYFIEKNLNNNLLNGLGYLRAAADSGYAPAQLDIAILYINGQIETKREAMIAGAERYLKPASDAGYVPAIYMYGYLNECQIISQKDKRIKTMFQYYKQSAEAGYAPGQYSTGLCYLQGLGTKQNLDKAGEWVTAAVNQGYKRAVDGQEAVFAELAKQKQFKRDERIRKWTNALAIVAGVADVASQAMTLAVPPSNQHYSNSSQVASRKVQSTSSQMISKQVQINTSSSKNQTANYGNYLNVKYAYEGYVKLLSDMRYRNPKNYSDRDRVNYQSKMKSIRTEWNSKYKTPTIYKNDIEDWNGSYR